MLAIFKRDVKIIFLRKQSWFKGLLFISCFILTLPITSNNDPLKIATLAPAILWLSLIFSILLTLNDFLVDDANNGSLDIFLLNSAKFPIALSLVKISAQWVSNILPLLVGILLLSLTSNIEIKKLLIINGLFLIATPGIVSIVAATNSLTLQLPRSQLLSVIMTLPLLIPLIIFGISATNSVINDEANFLAPFYFLIATSIFLSTIGIFFTAISLKYLK